MSEETILYRFRWWYKGKTVEGNIAQFSGYLHAVDCYAACAAVEKVMRLKHPDIRWMHGKKIETPFVQLGPTVQQLKRGHRKFKA